MISKTRMVRFAGRSESVRVIGERVCMRAPIEPLRSGNIPTVSVHGYIKHLERQILTLRAKYGRDCAHFELFLVDGKVEGIAFTRPMDAVELVEIRAIRIREQRELERQLDEGLDQDIPPPMIVVQRPVVAYDRSPLRSAPQASEVVAAEPLSYLRRP